MDGYDIAVRDLDEYLIEAMHAHTELLIMLSGVGVQALIKAKAKAAEIRLHYLLKVAKQEGL